MVSVLHRGRGVAVADLRCFADALGLAGGTDAWGS
jgi:hypothetical protein